MISFFGRALFLVYLLASFPFLCLGQQNDSDPDEAETPTIRENLVVTAQMEPETARGSLYPVTVLDHRRIQEQAATTLRELLSQELNMDLSQHSVFGSGLSIEGISGENVKILQDGVPVIGRLNGIIDLDHINLDAVDRVEIVEGPVSVYHGTDALAGVVNLISREPTFDGFRGSFDSYYRSVDERTLHGGLEWGGERQGIQADGALRRFDGYSNQDQGRELDWGRRDQDWLSLRYSNRWRALVLSAGTRFFDEELVDPGAPQSGIARDVTYRTRRGGQHLSARGFLGEFYLDAQLSYADYERDQRVSLFDEASGLSGEPGPAASRTAFDQWLGRVALSRKHLLSRVDLQAGLELSRESGEGGRLLDDGQRMRDNAVFSTLRWSPTPRFQVQPAFRYSHNSSFGGLFTPALHLKFDATENVDLRASYAGGYRGPSLKESYLDFTMAAGPFIYHILGNPDLEPERGRHAQASLEARHPWHGESMFTLEASLFDNRVEDLIALGDLVAEPGSPNRLERQYINLASHRTRGARLVVEKTGSVWDTSLGISRTEVANQLAQDAPVPQFSGYTDGRFRASLRPGSGRTRFHLLYKYHGSRPGFILVKDSETGSATAEEVRQEAFQLLDVGASHGLFDGKLQIQAGAKNLFDVRELDSVIPATGEAHAESQVDWGRNYYLRLHLTWKN